jgi:hypothetical protein
MPKSSHLSHSLWFSDQNSAGICVLPHTCHIFSSPYLPWFDRLNNTGSSKIMDIILRRIHGKWDTEIDEIRRWLNQFTDSGIVENGRLPGRLRTQNIILEAQGCSVNVVQNSLAEACSSVYLQRHKTANLITYALDDDNNFDGEWCIQIRQPSLCMVT